MSEEEKEEWIVKSWPTRHMESHDTAEHEPILLIYWINLDPAPVVPKEVNQNLRYFKSICGDCKISVDRSLEKEADGIIFRNERIQSYMKVIIK